MPHSHPALALSGLGILINDLIAHLLGVTTSHTLVQIGGLPAAVISLHLSSVKVSVTFSSGVV